MDHFTKIGYFVLLPILCLITISFIFYIAIPQIETAFPTANPSIILVAYFMGIVFIIVWEYVFSHTSKTVMNSLKQKIPSLRHQNGADGSIEDRMASLEKRINDIEKYFIDSKISDLEQRVSSMEELGDSVKNKKDG